jgi:4-alpha-glucanotransferase
MVRRTARIPTAKYVDYLKRPPGDEAEAAPALIGLAWSSVAALTIAPLQDLLNLGGEARMNVPGRTDGNWRWRASADMLSFPSFEWLRELTESADRSVSPKITMSA